MIVRMFLLYLSSKISFCCCIRKGLTISQTQPSCVLERKKATDECKVPHGACSTRCGGTQLGYINVREHCAVYMREALRCRWPSLRQQPGSIHAFFFFFVLLLSLSRLFDIPARRVYIYASCPRFLIFSHPLIASSWEKPVLKILMV